MIKNKDKHHLDPIGALNDASYSGFHRNVTIIASMGAFSDAFVITVLGASTFSIVPYLLHTTSNLAFTASLIFIGAVVGLFSMGTVVDKIGRRLMFILTLALVFIFSLLSAFVNTSLELNILRFLLGFATGADYPAAMALLSEFLPTKRRGRGMAYMWGSWVVGAASGFLLGYFLYTIIGPTPYEWRIMLGSAAIPAFIGMIMRTSLPESPRWAIERGKYDIAGKSIKRATGLDFTTGDLEGVRTKYFANEKVNLKNHHLDYLILILPVVAGVFCFNLVTGALSTLTPTILSSLGIAKATSYLYATITLAAQFVGVMIVAFFVEKVGRMRIAVIGGVLEGVMALLVTVLFHNPYALLGLFMGLYIFAFMAVPVLRTAGSELFPTEFRGFSSGVVMAGDRFASVAGLLITPILFVNKNVVLLFSVYGVIGIAGAIIAFIGLRKKKIDRKSLEDIQLQILGEKGMSSDHVVEKTEYLPK